MPYKVATEFAEATAVAYDERVLYLHNVVVNSNQN